MNPLSIWSSSGIYTNLPYGYDTKFNGRIPEGKSENTIADRRGKKSINNSGVKLHVKATICLSTMKIIITTMILVLITKTIITKSIG